MRSKRARRHITSEANNKVPGYPLEIFDFVGGSGSYISDPICPQVQVLSPRPILIKVDSKRINLNFFVLFHLLSAFLFV